MKVTYFVNYGPNNSHLIDCKSFDKLKDAKYFAENLPLTPLGEKRPYKINRIEAK